MIMTMAFQIRKMTDKTTTERKLFPEKLTRIEKLSLDQRWFNGKYIYTQKTTKKQAKHKLTN